MCWSGSSGSLGYPILAFDLSTAFWPTLICILQLLLLLPLFAGQLGSARTWPAAPGQTDGRRDRQAGRQASRDTGRQGGWQGLLRLRQSAPSGFQLCSLLSHLIYGLPSTRPCQLNEIKPCNEQKLCATCNFHYTPKGGAVHCRGGVASVKCGSDSRRAGWGFAVCAQFIILCYFDAADF